MCLFDFNFKWQPEFLLPAPVAAAWLNRPSLKQATLWNQFRHFCGASFQGAKVRCGMWRPETWGDSAEQNIYTLTKTSHGSGWHGRVLSFTNAWCFNVFSTSVSESECTPEVPASRRGMARLTVMWVDESWMTWAAAPGSSPPTCTNPSNLFQSPQAQQFGGHTGTTSPTFGRSAAQTPGHDSPDAGVLRGCECLGPPN